MRLSPNLPAHALRLAVVLTLFVAPRAHALGGMDVEIWTDRGDDAVYQTGDAMRVKVRASGDAYLLVYEIDADGNVNLLYPWKRGSGMVEGRRTLRLPPDDADYQLVVEKETGQGFLVAVASDRPFRDLPWFLRPFDPQAASVGYEGAPQPGDETEEGFDEDGRVVGDPYVAMERIRRRVLDRPGDTGNFATAYSTYYVHEQVRYPRYLCNDCHRPNRWAWWDGFDPYYAHCSVMDFRVNWSWCWGPQIWTAYVPYYYYVVRTDCPPRYQPWVGSRNRFSSWDGWDRWSNLWGGQLRRYKPEPVPVTYSPPPPRGMIWKKGETPPGYVPSDVRRQTSSPGSRPTTWLKRDVGNGRPVWKDAPRTRPEGGVRRDDGFRQDGGRVRPDGGQRPPQVEDSNARERTWRTGERPGYERPRGGDRGGFTPPSRDNSRGERPSWRPTYTPPSGPPQQAPQRQEPPRQDPGYKQAPPPRSEPPRWSPPSSRPDRSESSKGKDKGGKG